MATAGAGMLSVHVNAINGHQLSADKRGLSLLLEAKHVGALTLLLSMEQVQHLSTVLDQVKSELSNQTAAKDQLTVTVPKTWAVTADVKVHDLVLLMFNRKTDSQATYGIDPAAAKGIAEGLMKNADVVLRKKQAAATNGRPRGKH